MKTLMTSLAALAFASAAAAAPAPGPQPGDHLKLNQIQVVGTHNSYSQPADPRVFAVMKPLIQRPRYMRCTPP